MPFKQFSSPALPYAQFRIKKANASHTASHITYSGDKCKLIPLGNAKKLLPSKSAKFVCNLIQMANSPRWPQREGRFSQWLSREMEFDEDGLKFVDLLLRSDTCAPLDHLTVEYGLGCMSSLYDRWFRIKGGSETLVTTLFARSRATLRRGTEITGVRNVRKGVQVRGAVKGKPFSGVFRGVIITVPKGERLLGKDVQGHFHTYLSFLLECPSAPRLKAKPKFDLERGLYTDSPLNYIQVRRWSTGSHVIRGLIPDADKMTSQSHKALVEYCVQNLSMVINHADRFVNPSVKLWRAGLPCGGNWISKLYHLENPAVRLAGDRFETWPSMDAAFLSGTKVAKALEKFLRK